MVVLIFIYTFFLKRKTLRASPSDVLTGVGFKLFEILPKCVCKLECGLVIGLIIVPCGPGTQHTAWNPGAFPGLGNPKYGMDMILVIAVEPQFTTKGSTDHGTCIL